MDKRKPDSANPRCVPDRNEANNGKASGKPVLQLSFTGNTDKLKDTQISYYPYDDAFLRSEKTGRGILPGRRRMVFCH